MAFSLAREENNIIKVVFNDAVDFQQRVAAVDQVCQLVQEGEVVKLLVDLSHFENLMTLDEQEKFGIYLASQDELENAKVASVTAHACSENVIVEAVAFTNGYQVVNFHSLKDAQAWLLGEFN
ncbi:hypothetical protein OA92_07350 [Marinomonas sp. SBI22]|uniref:hypothetical protein n=1 Tax=unclassified Marinomonas TaxID=196814 RepID=UPI0007AF1639|nr:MULTISPECIES: hypothetical protein [unclassified Marinomonas]KZM40428.1 hypothetical protein OA91_19550 [Marinomonas sp. SBI8L]KZM43519.1 hypothetical protein OA92_07350 [Marinomonas sp. SBI22]